uniref:(northern house mosquito) hypothetical protein n=1 Tax=Culex pipiens TaxID=7175 RepID=A0A8D8C2J9_CULPI
MNGKGFFFTATHKILHRGKKKAYIFNLVFSHSTIFPGISYVYCLLVALFPLRHTYSAGHVAYLMPTTHLARDVPLPHRILSPKRFYFGSIPTFPCGAFTLDCLRNQTNPRISCAFFSHHHLASFSCATPLKRKHRRSRRGRRSEFEKKGSNLSARRQNFGNSLEL